MSVFINKLFIHQNNTRHNAIRNEMELPNIVVAIETNFSKRFSVWLYILFIRFGFRKNIKALPI
jgi:hypothetical protein